MRYNAIDDVIEFVADSFSSIFWTRKKNTLSIYTRQWAASLEYSMAQLFKRLSRILGLSFVRSSFSQSRQARTPTPTGQHNDATLSQYQQITDPLRFHCRFCMGLHQNRINLYVNEISLHFAGEKRIDFPHCSSYVALHVCAQKRNWLCEEFHVSCQPTKESKDINHKKMYSTYNLSDDRQW